MHVNFFVITGGPGAGKTTLIEELKRRGVFCVEEVARKIIQDEVASDGEALPWKNTKQYIERLIISSIETYEEALKKGPETIIFDRGILDYVSYAKRMKTDVSDELLHAADSLVYNKKVFIAPPWEEIYCMDSERKQTFEEALEVYHTLLRIYGKNRYETIEIPKTTVENRADFLISHAIECT